ENTGSPTRVAGTWWNESWESTKEEGELAENTEGALSAEAFRPRRARQRRHFQTTDPHGRTRTRKKGPAADAGFCCPCVSVWVRGSYLVAPAARWEPACSGYSQAWVTRFGRRDFGRRHAAFGGGCGGAVGGAGLGAGEAGGS